MEHPIKILIVEDNVIIADDMQSMLEEIGYEIVDNVIVYEQAVDVLKNNHVDLVLIDIILASDKTGIDLGKHIRETYNIPFIFVTSNSDRATVENAKTVKPDGYLVKPFEQQDLYTSIEIALSNFNYAKLSTWLKIPVFIKNIICAYWTQRRRQICAWHCQRKFY